MPLIPLVFAGKTHPFFSILIEIPPLQQLTDNKQPKILFFFHQNTLFGIFTNPVIQTMIYLVKKIDDVSITVLVKMTLLYHSSTSALNTRVETKDGVVTLAARLKMCPGRNWPSDS